MGPYFVEPEILQKRGYDNKSDMWRIGVIAYALLSGVYHLLVRIPMHSSTTLLLENIHLRKNVGIMYQSRSFNAKTMQFPTLFIGVGNGLSEGHPKWPEAESNMTIRTYSEVVTGKKGGMNV